MTPLTQVSDISTLENKVVYHKGEFYSLGMVTIVSHVAGLTWGTEVKDENGRIFFLSGAELFLVEAGDMVVIHDYSGYEAVGKITLIRKDSLGARFATGKFKFGFHYIKQIYSASAAASASCEAELSEAV